MSQSELKDMAKQARRCYQHYRRSETEFQLHLLDFENDKKFIQMMDKDKVHFAYLDMSHTVVLPTVVKPSVSVYKIPFRWY